MTSASFKFKFNSTVCVVVWLNPPTAKGQTKHVKVTSYTGENHHMLPATSTRFLCLLMFDHAPAAKTAYFDLYTNHVTQVRYFCYICSTSKSAKVDHLWIIPKSPRLSWNLKGILTYASTCWLLFLHSMVQFKTTYVQTFAWSIL